MNHSMTATATRRRVGLGAGLLQCAGLSALAYLICALFGPRPLWADMLDGSALGLQVGLGTVIAFAFCVPTLIAVLKVNFFGSFRTLVLDLPNRLDVSGWNPVWFGLCAGVGEELLFRGALQPLLGIWWTGLLFALAHAGTGGFKSMNRMKWGYAAFLVLTSLMFGFVLIHMGLMTAVVAHAVADTVIFFVLRDVAGREGSRGP